MTDENSGQPSDDEMLAWFLKYWKLKDSFSLYSAVKIRESKNEQCLGQTTAIFTCDSKPKALSCQWDQTHHSVIICSLV